jgi:predicted O-methyltransferase YrrM
LVAKLVIGARFLKSLAMNSETRWAEVDGYVTDLLVKPETALEEALALSAAAGLPAINVSAPQGKFLHLIARAIGAKRILEVGTLGGYSTIWLARALPDDGKLVTLEFEHKHAEVARRNMTRAGLDRKVELRVGPANESMAALSSEGAAPFDLIFIDANKEGYPEYLLLAMKLARVGSLIVADNIIRKGEVIDANSSDERVQGVRRFNELVAAEPRLSATAIQTVGSKGYDGFTIALVIK